MLQRKTTQLTTAFKKAVQMLEDPGLWFPAAYATLNKSTSGPIGWIATGIGALMLGAKLHQHNSLGPVSRFLHRHETINRFLQKETALLKLSGYGIMAASVSGAAFLGAGLAVSAASFLIGLSLYKKSRELEEKNPKPAQTLFQKIKQQLYKSETITGGVALIVQALQLGPYVFLSYPFLAASFAAATTGDPNPLKPKWKMARRLGMSDASFSRWNIATAAFISGSVGALAMGRWMIGISGMIAAGGNWMILRMMMKKDLEAARQVQQKDESARSITQQPAAPYLLPGPQPQSTLQAMPFIAPLFNTKSRRIEMGFEAPLKPATPHPSETDNRYSP